MAVTVHIAIAKTLEVWWGVDDLLADMADATDEEKKEAIIELVGDDRTAFIDGAEWTVTILDDEQEAAA